MGSVWIQNCHTSGITVKAISKTGVESEKTFPIQKEDRFTGRLIENGYTEVTEEEHKTLLEGSKLYAKFLADGRLVEYEKPPLEALNPAAQLIALSAENRVLKAELEEIKKCGAGDSVKVAELQKTVDGLTAELLAVRSNDLAKELEDTKKQHATELEELNTAHATELEKLNKRINKLEKKEQ